MPARAAWKGFLQIRQLQVPVKAFSAASTQPEIPLNQLHGECGQRIRQLKVCPTHGEVASEQIVSGYEFAEGRYLPLPPEELEALQPEDGKAILVDCFVSSREIDAVHHSGRTYYVVPDGPPGQRPFGVLRDGMRAADRYGVSRVVMGNRELLVLLRAVGRLIAMTVLLYPERVRGTAEYEGEVSATDPGPEERMLMGQLIDAHTDREFDVSRYRDRYVDGLNRLIERRLAEVDLSERPPVPQPAAQIAEPDDSAVVAALRASLSAAGVDDLPARIPSLTERSPREESRSNQRLA
jgi:DNA end-binding protein Ku